MDTIGEVASTIAPGSLKIILVSAPGLRRDSLLALLQSNPGIQKVVSTDLFEECEKAIPSSDPVMVVVDHTMNDDLVQKALPMIRRQNPKAWILMLVSHPRDTFAYTSCRPDSILCEGFSSVSLSQEIHKAFPLAVHLSEEHL